MWFLIKVMVMPSVYAMIRSVYRYRLFVSALSLTLGCLSSASYATDYEQKVAEQLGIPIKLLQDFTALYESELGSVSSCKRTSSDFPNSLVHKVCSKALRNEGNAPFILFPTRRQSPDTGIVVLFHGLSDSPFFLKGIAQKLQSEGYTVVVPLLPGNGKKEADFDMEDDELKARWLKHVDSIMTLVKPYSEKRFIGGFSTGGTLATHYAITHQDEINALLLFSGALALSSNAENLASIWGMKSIAKMVDGDFVTQGPHPYQYPDSAGYAAILSGEVIFEIRDLLANATDIDKSFPIFIAHSLADIISPYAGVEALSKQIEGEHQIFTIAESYNTCHRDLVMSSQMMVGLKIDKQALNMSERCAVPKPNPLFPQMMLMLSYFLQQR